MTTDKPLVSIVIPTRNRREEVLVAVGSCYAQTYRPIEVIVLDDASTDGTEEAVRGRFPETIYRRHEICDGIAALRNHGLREAHGDIVLSFDDDSYFVDPDTVRQVVENLDAHPEAGALAMPYVEPLRPPGRKSAKPEERQPPRVRSFTGCSGAFRRQAATEAGGYREFAAYSCEDDKDLSIRLLDRGFSTVVGSSTPLVHLYSPKREWGQRYQMDLQSKLIFDYLNIPHPYMLPRMLVDASQLLIYRFTLSQLLPRLGYILRAFGACAGIRGHRKPVSRETYRLYRSLPRHGPVSCGGDVPRPASDSSHIR
jgi:glycosyltransferase involved in cell wall biosynthesis